MRHDKNFQELKIDMMGLIFVGLLFSVVLSVHETLKVLGTTKSSVEMILKK